MDRKNKSDTSTTDDLDQANQISGNLSNANIDNIKSRERAVVEAEAIVWAREKSVTAREDSAGLREKNEKIRVEKLMKRGVIATLRAREGENAAKKHAASANKQVLT